jgi:hypothetical protein
VTQSLKAFNTNVLQCDTPLATYAHLAPSEPIAHPGRGMPVLSSTVHIARHAFFLSWAQTIFCFLFHAPLHGAVVWQALWLAHGGAFFGSRTCQDPCRREALNRAVQRCDPPSLKYMTIHYCSHQPISMGKFRIQPCSRALPNGAFGAQVSVASGRGSASTDRVMRFLPEFATPDAASQYALDEGMLWVERQTSKPILL